MNSQFHPSNGPSVMMCERVCLRCVSVFVCACVIVGELVFSCVCVFVYDCVCICVFMAVFECLFACVHIARVYLCVHGAQACVLVCLCDTVCCLRVFVCVSVCSWFTKACVSVCEREKHLMGNSLYIPSHPLGPLQLVTISRNNC